jgi:hypothetical protein
MSNLAAARATPRIACVAAAAMALLLAACSDAGSGAQPNVTIEPLTSTPAARTPPIGVAIGGKRAEPTQTATAPAPASEPSPDPTQPLPTEQPAATATAPSAASAPTSGRWIDVDVTNFSVRLMDGETTVREIAPVGVGVAIDTGDYISTQTGLFYVQTKTEALVYDAPFDTYISHWVGFDADKDNGFHSLLKDASGAVVDASTGRVSNGCIRTGEPDVIYAYAEIGMPVWVHW